MVVLYLYIMTCLTCFLLRSLDIFHRLTLELNRSVNMAIYSSLAKCSHEIRTICILMHTTQFVCKIRNYISMHTYKYIFVMHVADLDKNKIKIIVCRITFSGPQMWWAGNKHLIGWSAFQAYTIGSLKVFEIYTSRSVKSCVFSRNVGVLSHKSTLICPPREPRFAKSDRRLVIVQNGFLSLSLMEQWEMETPERISSRINTERPGRGNLCHSAPFTHEVPVLLSVCVLPGGTWSFDALAFYRRKHIQTK